MKNMVFRGCAVALATPMMNGEIDYEALKALVDEQLAGGTDGIVACGTTGEPSTMTADEQERVIAAVAERVNGRVPVIAGTGGNNTAHVIQNARRYKQLGAVAQLCVTPYYNKTTQAGLIAHYTAIADQTELPIIIYNVPARTGLNMLPTTLAKLSEHENIVGMKEAAGDIAQMADMLNLCGDKLALYTGADELIAPCMALGGQGVISVVSNIAPRLLHDMVRMELADMGKLQVRLMPLLRLLFAEVNPIPVKAALAMQGLCKNELRLPLVPISAENAVKLQAELQKQGLLTC